MQLSTSLLITTKRAIIYIITFLLAFIITGTLKAQELEHQAPSLQVGLDGLSFARGTLDAQLIAEIIGQKQSEIKLKVVQNSFLQKINGAGGTVYNYADNIIKGIVLEPEPEIRTRKMVENTVNLVFVYAFADFYVRKAAVDDNYKSALNALALEIDPSLTTLNYGGGLIHSKLDSAFKQTSSNKRDTKAFISEPLSEFIATIIDISSEVVREDEKLRKLGLMRISYSSTYEYMNLYRKSKTAKADTVNAQMKRLMSQYTHYIGAVNYVLTTSNFKSNLIGNLSQFLPSNSGFAYNDVPTFINPLQAIADTLEKSLKKMAEDYKSLLVYSTTGQDVSEAIQSIAQCLEYVKNVQEILKSTTIDDAQKALLISDILYSIEAELKPLLTENIKHYPGLLAAKNQLTQVAQKLYQKLISDYPQFKSFSNDPQPFIRLVAALYEFDKTSTFSDYRNLLSLLDGVFEDGKIKYALSTINNFVKDYIVIKEVEGGKEVIDFNVESFLVKLQNIQSDKISRIQFHFTVGMNSTFFNKEITVADTMRLTNLSHVSEKIGIKFKLASKGEWWPRNPGEAYKSYGKYFTKVSPPKEPLISNWHIIVYGSGILYNVINSSTNSQFAFPMAAVGTGLTFYNALDLNVSLGVPILPKGGIEEMGRYPFINVGFDIQFTEYIQALNKKRESNKIQKQLAKASALD